MKLLSLALVLALELVVPEVALAQTAALLPNGMQQFIDGNGNPYAGGSVYFYIPSTTTFKTTWVDPNQGVANANPVVLDSAGRAVIYGSGQYREVLKDSLGNTVWDQLTNGVIGGGSGGGGTATVYYGGTSTGVANAQIVGSATGWTLVVGNVIYWRSNFTNTNATTLNVQASGVQQVRKQTAAGLVALVGNEIVAGNAYSAVWDGAYYELVNPNALVVSAITLGTVLTGNGNGQLVAVGPGTSGQVLTSNGAAAPSYQTPVVVNPTFESVTLGTTVWTVPAGVVATTGIKFRVVGGGGGGGGAGSNDGSTGGGGAAGDYLEAVFTGFTAGQNVGIVAGGGGAAGGAGGTGGTGGATTVSYAGVPIMSAVGGGGGAGGNSATVPADAGVQTCTSTTNAGASGLTLNSATISGGCGGGGQGFIGSSGFGSPSYGGQGGGNQLGVGGRSQGTAVNGDVGRGWGGGGAGGARAGGVDRLGGAGTGGVVIIELVLK